MRFRNRLIFTYTAVVIIFASVLGLFFRQYILRQQDKSIYLDLQARAKNFSQQLDTTVQSMEFVMDHLVSDSEILSAMNILANDDRSDLARSYISQAKRTVASSLTTYHILEYYYRVSIISPFGDFITSNPRLDSIGDGEALPTMLPELDLVEANIGTAVLSIPRPDPWARNFSQHVFSLCRAVRTGDSLSFLDVQLPAELIANLVAQPYNSEFDIIILNDRGEIFYSDSDKSDNDYYLKQIESLSYDRNLAYSGRIAEPGNGVTAFYYSPSTRLFTIGIQKQDLIYENYAYINNIILIVVVLSVILSAALIAFSSFRLTSPIDKLIGHMEKTTLDNIGQEEITTHTTNNELIRLSDTYNKLLDRLKQSVSRENQLKSLNIQAEFDALQAQVDPHFIYNVLNSISSRGVITGDEVVCDLCNNLASMLRYSTSTSRRLVMVEEEITYVRNYLYLQKMRFRDKLTYEINIDSGIYKYGIPKTVIQQLVENSISHGFHDKLNDMYVEVVGKTSDGYWFIEVQDNGCGFSTQSLDDIDRKIAEIRNKAEAGGIHDDLNFGGMGIVNGYARMLLIYGNEFIFKCENNKNGIGATVIIGAKIEAGKQS